VVEAVAVEEPCLAKTGVIGYCGNIAVCRAEGDGNAISLPSASVGASFLVSMVPCWKLSSGAEVLPFGITTTPDARMGLPFQSMVV
jgi:hypothetical protein